MQRRRRRGFSTARGTGQGLELGLPLASDSEDDELRWRPGLGDTVSPRVVPESDSEEPDVCPDVRGPQKRRHTPTPGHHADAASPWPDPDVRGPKKRRFGPQTAPDPDVGRKIAIPDVQPPNHTLNPKKVANPDVNCLEGSNPTLDVETDTDVKVPPKTALFVPNCHRVALEVSSNPDVEERGPNPDVGTANDKCQMLVVDSDTDVEEAEVLPDVGCPQIHRMAPNTQKKTGVEMGPPNPDVGGAKNGCWTLVESNTDVGMEKNSAVEGPKNEHRMLIVDSDTDVEEDRASPDVGCPQSHRTTQNVPKKQNIEIGTQNADVDGSKKSHQMLMVDSDTDVEENGADPDVGCPQSHRTTQNVPKNQTIEMGTQNADVGGSKTSHQMLMVDSDTDVEENGADPDVGYPKPHQTTQNVPKDQNIEMGTQNVDVGGSKTSHQMFMVDSDTDVEENGADPDVGYPKPHQTTQNVPKDQNIEMGTQNVDVDGSKTSHQMLMVDSDTDVEENGADPDVGYPKPHQTTQNVPKNQTIEMGTQNADVGGSKTSHQMFMVDSDTDVEENGADPDVGYPKPHQTTQNVPKKQNTEMGMQNADVDGSQKGNRMLMVDSDTDVEEDTSNPDVGCPESHRTAPRGPVVKTETTNGEVEGRRTLLMESDTDVEEDTSNPDVGTLKIHRATQNVPRNPDVEKESPNPHAKEPQNKQWTLVVDSDTDVEENEVNPNVGCPKIQQITQKGPDVEVTSPNPDVNELQNEYCNLEVDSDTGVEEDNLGRRVLHPKSHKTPQNTRKDPTVVMETPNPDVGSLSRGSVASNGDSDTDVEDLDALANVGAPKTGGATHEVMDTVAKMAAAPDVVPKGPTRTNDDPDVKITFPAPDDGAPKAQCPVLNVDSDTDVEDNSSIPDVETAQRCQGASGDPDVATTPPNPDVSSPTSPRDGTDTDMEEVAPTPDVRSLWTHIRTRNRPHPGVGGPTTGSDTNMEGTDPKRRKSSPKRQSLSPKSHGDASVEGMVPNRADSAPNTDVEASNPDVGTPPRGKDPAVPPDVSTPKSPCPAPNLGVTGDADGGPRSAGATPGGDTGATVTESDADTEEDPDLFLEPTQSFLPPVANDTTLSWDPEEPTQPFFPREVEEEEDKEVGEGPRRSQRLARSRGGGATGGGATGGGASGRGGATGGRAPPVSTPVRRSPRLQARPPPSEPPVTRGRGQVEPRPPPKPHHSRAGPAPSKRQAQEEEPPEVVRPQLRPRGGLSSTPPKVLFTGVVASPGMEVALKTLGGSLATSVFDCTHLVTDRVRRTVKFLCAVARGVPIVTPEWLHKSVRSGRILVPGPFLVRDSQQERHFGFSLAQALRRARRHPLLQGYEVHVTPNVRPEPEHMRDIVTCSGGTFLPTMPHTYGPRRLVISCEADAGCWAPALGARLPLASAELLLTGLLRQRLQLQPFLLLPTPETPPNSHGTPTTPPRASTAPPGVPPQPPGDGREPPGTPGSPRGSREVLARGRSRRPPRDPPGEPPRDPPGTRRRPAAPPTRQ
ncbi:mediator of DNA damage checkpoint protein 1 [Morus bassanus]